MNVTPSTKSKSNNTSSMSVVQKKVSQFKAPTSDILEILSEGGPDSDFVDGEEEDI